MSTHDTSFAHAASQIILFGGESLTAAKITESSLKGNKLMHIPLEDPVTCIAYVEKKTF